MPPDELAVELTNGHGARQGEIAARWCLLGGAVTVSSLAVRPLLASRGEVFWLLLPLWVGLGAWVLKVLPAPRLPSKGRWARRWAVSFLVLFPLGLYFTLAHFLHGRIAWPEVALTVYFFSLSLEAFLCYAFQAVEWLETRAVGGATRRAAVIRRVALRACLYALLVPFLLAVLSLHRAKIPPHDPPPELGLTWEPVSFPSRGDPPLRLGGWFFPCAEPLGTILACHGVGANRGDLLEIVWILHSRRFQVLSFDFRGHGDSAGHTVTYGHFERDDVLGAWDYLRRRPDVDAMQLFAFGVSMGGASLLQALPDLDGVRAAVVDSSFAELTSMLRHQYRHLPGLVAETLAPVTAYCGWLETGIDVANVSPLRSLERTRVPIFFIHGEADTIVPPEETRRLHAAYTGAKRLWIEADAGHGGTAAQSHSRYGRTVRDFLLGALNAEPPR